MLNWLLQQSGGRHGSGDAAQPRSEHASPAGTPTAAGTQVVPAHILLGQEGEDVAAALLKARGYRILSRNWRQGRLELDMVCRHEDSLVFVEVKTRRSAAHGGPAAGLTLAKQRSLSRAAALWLNEHDAWQQPCRFDVVLVLRDKDLTRAELYCHAFDFSPTLDNCHASWQPW